MENLWDYVIVGGGILGCAIGKTILERRPEASVLILEKNDGPGLGNTIKSNAAYRNIFDTDVNILLAGSTIKYFTDQEKLGYDFGRDEIGYLFLLTEEQYQSYGQPTLPLNEKHVSFFEFLTHHEIAYEVLDADSLQQKFPQLSLHPENELAEMIQAKQIQYGLWGKQCGKFAPDLVIQFYLQKFLESKGRIQYQTQVTKILLGAKDQPFDPEYRSSVWQEQVVHGVQVKSVDGETRNVLGKQVILATGAWINELLDPLGARSLTKAKKRQLFTIDHLDHFVKNSNFAPNYNTFPFTILPTGGVFLKPLEHAGSVVVGTSDVIGRAFEPTYLKGTASSNLDHPKAEENFFIYNILPVLQTYFPGIFDNIKTKGTAGMYAYSVDKYPVIDQVDGLGNLFIVTGASGSGIMKADSIARICVSRIYQEESAILYGGAEVQVARFGIKHRNLPHETLVI